MRVIFDRAVGKPHFKRPDSRTQLRVKDAWTFNRLDKKRYRVRSRRSSGYARS